MTALQTYEGSISKELESLTDNPSVLTEVIGMPEKMETVIHNGKSTVRVSFRDTEQKLHQFHIN